MSDEEKKTTLELTHDQLVFIQDLVDLGTLAQLSGHGAHMTLEAAIMKERLALRIKVYGHKIGDKGLSALGEYIGKVHDQMHDAAEVEGFLKEIHG